MDDSLLGMGFVLLLFREVLWRVFGEHFGLFGGFMVIVHRELG